MRDYFDEVAAICEEGKRRVAEGPVGRYGGLYVGRIHLGGWLQTVFVVLPDDDPEKDYSIDLMDELELTGIKLEVDILAIVNGDGSVGGMGHLNPYILRDGSVNRELITEENRRHKAATHARFHTTTVPAPDGWDVAETSVDE